MAHTLHWSWDWPCGKKRKNWEDVANETGQRGLPLGFDGSNRTIAA